MTPDDRLRDLLRRSEDGVRPDPIFLATLSRRLDQERHRRRSPWYRFMSSASPIATYGLVASLVVAVGFVSVLFLGLNGRRQDQGVGGSASPIAAATSTTGPASSPPSTQTLRTLCFIGSTSLPQPTACPLPAGTYSVAPFTPSFHFTLGEGWSNDVLDPTGGEVLTSTSSIFYMVNPQGGDNLSQVVAIGPGPDGVIAYLQQLPNVTTTPPVDVTLAGGSARQIDVSSTARNRFVFLTTAKDRLGGVGFGLNATTKARVLILQRSGATVVIVVSTASPQAFDATIAALQPVLDSIAWD
jgi:hypothetical protein